MRVAAGLAWRQQGQRGPFGPRVLERVVQRVDLRVHRVAAADPAEQPELLLVGHVREVPYQGRHQRRMLPQQFVFIEAVRQPLCPLPRGIEPSRYLVAKCAGIGGDGHDGPSWFPMASRMSSAGHLPRCTYLSAKSVTAFLTAGGVPDLASDASAASKHCRAALARAGSARPRLAARNHGLAPSRDPARDSGIRAAAGSPAPSAAGGGGVPCPCHASSAAVIAASAATGSSARAATTATGTTHRSPCWASIIRSSRW